MDAELENGQPEQQTRAPRTSVPGMPDDLRPGKSSQALEPAEQYDDELDDDTQPDADEPDPQDSQDDSDEPQESQEQESREVNLSDDELDTAVRFGDGKVMTLRELREGYDNRLDRKAWLQKTNALATERQRYEKLSAELGQLAESRDIPHVHLANVLTSYVEKGLIPAQLLQDIDTVWREYEQRGEYDRRGVEGRAQLERERSQIQQERGAIVRDQAANKARSEIQAIERTYGAQGKDVRQKIWQVIEHSHVAGNPMSVTQAFEYLRANKAIRAVRLAQPSTQRVEQRLKSATIGRSTTAPEQATRSKDDEAMELWSALHHRK